MAADDRRGVIEAERSSRSAFGRGGGGFTGNTTARAAADMETDCGPEDVIRWQWPPGMATMKMMGQCTSDEVENGEVGNYCYSAGAKGVGPGKQMLYTQSNNNNNDSVQVKMQHRQQRQEESAARLSSSSSSDTGDEVELEVDEECCTTSGGDCIKALRFAQPRRSLLVTVLMCTYLMLSSLPTVALAGRQQQQQDGKWTPPLS